MPIVPCFDPATGASGGPQSGGGGTPGGIRLLGDLSSATFTDSQAMLTGYSFDAVSGVHSFGCASIPTPNLDMVSSSGNNFSGPKWILPLTYDDGSPVSWDDAFTMTVIHDKNLDLSSPTCPERYILHVGVVNNPTSTSLINMEATMSAIGVANSTASANVGLLKRNSINLLSLTAGCLSASMVWTYSGKNLTNNQCSGQACATRRKSDGLPITLVKSNGNNNVADGTQVSLAVFLALSTSSAAAIGGTFTGRVRYTVQKLEMIP